MYLMMRVVQVGSDCLHRKYNWLLKIRPCWQASWFSSIWSRSVRQYGTISSSPKRLSNCITCLHKNSVTAILPALIVHLLTMRSLSSSTSDRELASRRFQCSMEFLKSLGDIYWHASFYHEFFELAASTSDTPLIISNRKLVKSLGKLLAPKGDIMSHNGNSSGASHCAEPALSSQISPLNGGGLVQTIMPGPTDQSDLHVPASSTTTGDNPDPMQVDADGLTLLEGEGQFVFDWLDDPFYTLFPSA